MPLLLGGGFDDDLNDGAAAIVAATGVDPHPWFRCPFGAGADDPRVIAEIERLGYRNVGWHVALEDWEPWRTGDAIATDAIAGVTARGDGTVVLLHTWPGGTAEGLPQMIDGLRDAGATFVTIDALEEVP